MATAAASEDDRHRGFGEGCRVPVRKRASSALLESEQHLRLFVEEVRDYAVLMLDPDGIVTSWNSGARAIKGYESDEIIGRHFSAFYTPEDIKAGKPQRGLSTAAKKGRFEDVGMRLRKDGSRFLADVVITPIFGNRRKLLGFGKITRDISERAASETKLKASEMRLQSLVDTVLDTLVDGVIIIDRKGKIQLYNHSCERLFGYKREQVAGKNVAMLMPQPTRREHCQYLRNYQSTGIRRIIGISREVIGLRQDGSQFPMHLAVGEMQQDEQPVYVGIIHDLTERNRTEEQLRQAQKMEAVGQLTGGIAHDFNNILMVILANADALLDDSDIAAKESQRLEQIGKAAQRAAELTHRLLAFSRRQTLQPRATNLNDLVEATGKLLRRTLGDDIAFKTLLAKGLRTVSIDRAQFESLLVNLCLNARDAMPSGGSLLVETRNADLDADYIRDNPEVVPGPYAMLAVTDTGTGIPPEVLSRVFEPFYTTKELGKGTGLGLSMVYGFVKQSAGHIKIYSEVGKGTTIRVYLPRSEGSHQALAAESARPMPTGSERLLVVEDDAQVRHSVVEQLRSLGYRVAEASNGAAGLEAFETTTLPYDLVLTDVVMPGPLAGRQLAAEILKRWPGTPIVFMSGYTEDAVIRQGRLEPGVRLLSKPFRKRDLARIVREALDGRNST